MHGRLVEPAPLVETALLGIAEKGIQATVIEDVMATAGVSFRTFSNHFSDVQDLMPAARDALVDEWLGVTLSAVAEVEDPAQSCAMGPRVAFVLAKDYPLLARFHIMIGVNFLRRGNLCSVLLPPLVQCGMDLGRFRVSAVDLLVDCLAAIMVVALLRIAVGQALDMSEVIAAVLRLLNVKPDEVEGLAAQSVHPVTPPLASLIARSDATMRQNLTQRPTTI